MKLDSYDEVDILISSEWIKLLQTRSRHYTTVSAPEMSKLTFMGTSGGVPLYGKENNVVMSFCGAASCVEHKV